MRNLCVIMLASLIAFSCSDRLSIVKRRYSKGYYIAMKHRPESKPRKETSDRLTARAVQPSQTSEVAVLSNDSHVSGTTEIPATTNANSARFTSKHSKPAKNLRQVSIPAETYKVKSLDEKQFSSRRAAIGEEVDSDVMLVLLVILAIFLPPLAIYLKSKDVRNKWFLITLILCLVSLIGWWFFFYSGLLYLAAVVIALLYVFDMLS
jgi:uncharacterized membrane protein YqaE (UPF0057 family)